MEHLNPFENCQRLTFEFLVERAISIKNLIEKIQLKINQNDKVSVRNTGMQERLIELNKFRLRLLALSEFILDLDALLANESIEYKKN